MMKDRYSQLKEAFQDSKFSRYLSVSDARENLKKIKEILDSYQGKIELFALDDKDLTEILYESEMLSAAVRKSIAAEKETKLLFIDKDKTSGTIVKEKEFLKENGLMFKSQIEEKTRAVFGEKEQQIEVDFDGKILSVYSPLTFKRGYQKKNFICNYLLANMVEETLRKYEKENGLSFYKQIEPPFVCVMIRKDYCFSINTVCDGDNLENQKIINTITKALSLPDNAENMDLYSSWVKADPDEKEGMYFRIMSKKYLRFFLESAEKGESQKPIFPKNPSAD